VTRREFRLKDAKSDKFWAIEVEGAAHTVHFGRVGTNGQRKTKEFDDAAAAAASAAKLIASKVKKGYSELDGGGDTAAPEAKTAPEAKAAKAKAAKAKAGKAKAGKAKAAKTEAGKTEAEENADAEGAAAPAAEATVTLPPVTTPDGLLALGLEDWAWRLAPWRKLPPLERGEPKPFKRDKVLAKLPKTSYHKLVEGDSVIPRAMTPAESAFWWRVCLRTHGGDMLPTVAARLEAEPDDLGWLEAEGVDWPSSMDELPALRVLPHLLEPDALVDAIVERLKRRGIWEWSAATRGNSVLRICAGVAEHVVPYLPAVERERLRGIVLDGLDPRSWPEDEVEAPARWYFAAMLGCAEPVRELLGSWADDRFRTGYAAYYQRPVRLVLGLDDPEEILAEAKRLNARPDDAFDLRAWLAGTGTAGLDWAAEAVKEQPSYWLGEMLKVFFAGDVPELAGPAMTLMSGTKVMAKAADKWFTAHPAAAARGLLRLAGGRGKRADDAWGGLRDLVAAGHAELLAAAVEAEQPSAAVRARLEAEVLARDTGPALDLADLPDDLRAAIAAVEALPKAKKAGRPEWLSPEAVRPPKLPEGSLPPDAIAAVLRGVFEATIDGKAAGPGVKLLRALKACGEASSLEAFAWDLYETWERRGFPSQQKWVLHALGHLGGTATVVRLTPLVRAWPGQSQHARAVLGLEVLRTIGSDEALSAIAGIAAKLKFRALKQRAGDLMQDIARDRGLTAEALADRLVPDCGLDADGERVFDYGGRTFRFRLGPELAPMVQNDAGKLLKAPPKPGKKDDPEQAPAALKEWRTFRKLVKATLELQLGRLEQAMVAQRRWSPEEFDRFLARHPLLRTPVRMLVWVDHGQEPPRPFRVDDQGRRLDVEEDQALELTGPVGLLHPLQLPAEERARWQEILDREELLAPFPQLEREVFRVTAEERAGNRLERGAGAPIRPTSLRGLLAKLGWTRGAPQDAGVVSEHVKHFHAAMVTAVIQHEGISVDGYEFMDHAPIERAIFLTGLLEPWDCAWIPAERGLPLNMVDEVVLSEVLRAMAAVEAKAEDG
jgi:predicted DNA-binding WGR domain protein